MVKKTQDIKEVQEKIKPSIVKPIKIKEVSLSYNNCAFRKNYKRIVIDGENNQFIVTTEQGVKIQHKVTFPYKKGKETEILKTIVDQIVQLGYKHHRYVNIKKYKYLYE